MFVRPKLFLTFLGLCLLPLALLAAINYWNGERVGEASLHRDQERRLAGFKHEIRELMYEDQNELALLSQSKQVHNYLQTKNGRTSNSAVNRSTPIFATEGLSGQTNASDPLPVELTIRVASVLHSRSHFASISVFDQNHRPLILAERKTNSSAEPVAFRTKDFLSEQTRTDDRVWTSTAEPPLLSEAVPVFFSSVSTAPFGARIDYTVPIFSENQAVTTPQGALLGILKLDPILSEAAMKSTAGGANSDSNRNRNPSALIILDRSGKILYHSNEALKHQVISESMPYFQPVANHIYSSEEGRQDFTGPGNESFSVQYTRLPVLGVWAAVTSNYEQSLAETRRAGRVGFVIAGLLGLLSAVLLTLYWHRQSRGLERVTEGVAAIAKGKLDHRIDLQSSDDLRPLADNLGLMTRQLRDQLAREAETRQFQSFVRLSAILTHDLKNAIEALSLTVANMERHFDNKEFRADAMKSVTGATNNLRALVARLSNPVTTLSGEHKRPRPVDLIPMLRQAVLMIAEPAAAEHEVKVGLPDSLFALVDIERMDKVAENLIINALEAMNQKKGTLSIAAGTTAEGKPFFSVSDTGEGMSPRFIEEKLFRPFTTTKRRGVGLGLYTCREVVVANGGSIAVESQKGVGTTFRVVLPSAAADEGGKRQRRNQSHN